LNPEANATKSILANLKIKISKLLMIMIAPFLIIRSISNVTLTIIYVYLAREEQKSTGIITAVLFGITSVIAYTGLVTIGFEEDWDVKNPHVPEDLSGVSELFQQFDGADKSFP
jgi:hypothetical protein